MSDSTEKLTRREFLKAAGLATGGVAIGSLALLAACQNKTTNTSATTKATTSTNTLPPGVYGPPGGYPPLLEETYGCTSGVASDRWYTDDHIWVKEWEEGKVVIGISDKMQALLGTVTHCGYMFDEGVVVERGVIFAGVGAYKLSTDILSPVSGEITQINQLIRETPGILNNFPYSEGWLAVIRLARPQEMNDLIGPKYYAYLNAVVIPPTVPPKRS